MGTLGRRGSWGCNAILKGYETAGLAVPPEAEREAVLEDGWIGVELAGYVVYASVAAAWVFVAAYGGTKPSDQSTSGFVDRMESVVLGPGASTALATGTTGTRIRCGPGKSAGRQGRRWRLRVTC